MKCVIYCEGKPFDVVEHLKSKGWKLIPSMPTMSGLEIKRIFADGREFYQLVAVFFDDQPHHPFSDAEAIVLVDGMQFGLLPPASMVPNGFGEPQ